MVQALMRIGELAERTGLSLPTLRHYDETGLLSPSARTVGKFRLYSEADYEKLMVIRRMKPLGFTVDEMRQLLVVVEGLRQTSDLPDPERARLVAGLGSFVDAATERRDRLQRQLEQADEFISVLRQEMLSAGEPLATGVGAADATATDGMPQGARRVGQLTDAVTQSGTPAAKAAAFAAWSNSGQEASLAETAETGIGQDTPNAGSSAR